MVMITRSKRQYSLKANVALAPEPSPVNTVSTSARYGGRTVFSTWADVTDALVLTLSVGVESSDFILDEVVGELLISPSNLVECITDSSENIKAATCVSNKSQACFIKLRMFFVACSVFTPSTVYFTVMLCLFVVI